MRRYRQNPVTLELELITDTTEPRSMDVVRHFEAFKSPIDGSIIRNSRELKAHCDRHNVVPAGEFSKEFFERKAREREKFYKGHVDPKVSFQRKQQLYEAITRAERNGR